MAYILYFSLRWAGGGCLCYSIDLKDYLVLLFSCFGINDSVLSSSCMDCHAHRDRLTVPLSCPQFAAD